MDGKKVNATKVLDWKSDIEASVDQFNQWFMSFAPVAFRTTRVKTTEDVKNALLATNDLRNLNAETIKSNPGALPTLRMCTAPPLAVDRLIGLAGGNKGLIKSMEKGKLAVRMNSELLEDNLSKVCHVLNRLIDHDIFPWLEANKSPTDRERERSSTIVADRLCSSVANPIVRNAQEKRQLDLIAQWLKSRGYRYQTCPTGTPLKKMEPGTYAFRMNISVGESHKVNIPVDVVVQPIKTRRSRLPILIEAKSAGDYTNTNKRRKEEATKIHQLKATYGNSISYVLFLCGYFGVDYLAYEATEGIDWIWEHRIDDLAKLGL